MLPSTPLIIVLFFFNLITHAFDGTTTFDTILVAHAEPTFCPTPSFGIKYVPDPDYQVCCFSGYPTVTKSTAKRPGGKTIFACCQEGYTCTGAAPVMSDWSMDSNGDVHYVALATPPMPTQVFRCPCHRKPTLAHNRQHRNQFPTRRHTIATQTNGVVVYLYNDINNQNNNNNPQSNINNAPAPKSEAPGGGGLSPGAIGGISTACALAGTLLTAVSTWYGVKSYKARKSKHSAKAGRAEKGARELSVHGGLLGVVPQELPAHQA